MGTWWIEAAPCRLPFHFPCFREALGDVGFCNFSKRRLEVFVWSFHIMTIRWIEAAPYWCDFIFLASRSKLWMMHLSISVKCWGYFVDPVFWRYYRHHRKIQRLANAAGQKAATTSHGRSFVLTSGRIKFFSNKLAIFLVVLGRHRYIKLFHIRVF